MQIANEELERERSLKDHGWPGDLRKTTQREATLRGGDICRRGRSWVCGSFLPPAGGTQTDLQRRRLPCHPGAQDQKDVDKITTCHTSLETPLGVKDTPCLQSRFSRKTW